MREWALLPGEEETKRMHTDFDGLHRLRGRVFGGLPAAAGGKDPSTPIPRQARAPGAGRGRRSGPQPFPAHPEPQREAVVLPPGHEEPQSDPREARACRPSAPAAPTKLRDAPPPAQRGPRPAVFRPASARAASRRPPPQPALLGLFPPPVPPPGPPGARPPHRLLQVHNAAACSDSGAAAAAVQARYPGAASGSGGWRPPAGNRDPGRGVPEVCGPRPWRVPPLGLTVAPLTPKETPF